MRALLDTHTFLWWIDDNPELSEVARRILADSQNEIFVSAATGWEIAIKSALGRLDVEGDPERFFPEQMTLNSFQALPIEISHALHTYHLPDHHRDPFDRLLISQSQIEELPLITKDPSIGEYEVEIIW
jgi:PIN domain nuclease of toxin-antitoxin system